MNAITSEAIAAMEVVPGFGYRIGSVGNRAIPVGNLSEWQVDALKTISSFEAFPAGWDSYASPSIPFDVINLAIDLVRNISIDNMPRPRIVPVSGGGIQLEWEKGSRELELEVHPNLSVELLQSEGGVPLHDEPAYLASNAELRRRLSWVDAG